MRGIRWSEGGEEVREVDDGKAGLDVCFSLRYVTG